MPCLIFRVRRHSHAEAAGLNTDINLISLTRCFNMISDLFESRLIETKKTYNSAGSMCSKQNVKTAATVWETYQDCPRQAFCHHWLNQRKQPSVGPSECLFVWSMIKLPVSRCYMFKAFIGKCINLSRRPTAFSLLTLYSDPWHKWACLQVACLNKASTLNTYTK